MALKLDLNNLPEPLQKVKNFLKTPLFLLESEKIVIGLDAGSDSVKIAVLKDEPKRTQLIALGSAKIQGGTLEGGSEIISATGEIIEGGPGSIDPNILIQAIKDAVLDTQQKIKTRVVSSLKKDHVHVRTINVVYMPEEELNEGIRWEAEQYIPFPMSEALLDYMVLGDTTEAGVDKLETLVVAAQRADVENFVDTISQADLSVGSLSLESFGLWQTLAKGQPLKNDEPVALVNIGNTSTNITIFEGEKLLFLRDIPLGGLNLTQAVQESMGIDFNEAEELKKTAGFDDQSQVYTVLLPVIEQLGGEITRSFDFFRAQTSRQIKELEHIVLAGGTALLKNIDNYLADLLGMEVEILNAFKNIECDNTKFDKEILAQSSPVFATAIGLALTAKRPKQINLLPEELVKGKVATLKDLYPKLIAGGVIIFLAMTYLPLIFKKNKIEKNIQSLRKSKKELLVIAAESNDLAKKKKKIKNRAEFLKVIQGKYGLWNKLLGDLGRTIPREVWLTEVSLIKNDNNKKLKILGSAADNASIWKFILNLKLQPYFSNVVNNHTKTRFDSGQSFIDFEIIVSIKDK